MREDRIDRSSWGTSRGLLAGNGHLFMFFGVKELSSVGVT
jgi:hypothetical protein